jgi:hypothetical protein
VGSVRWYVHLYLAGALGLPAHLDEAKREIVECPSLTRIQLIARVVGRVYKIAISGRERRAEPGTVFASTRRTLEVRPFIYILLYKILSKIGIIYLYILMYT